MPNQSLTTADILLQLNEQQRAAVEYCDGPQLVIAGAGSGKTRVLTYKIAYLIQQGMRPWNILALTFTNKAANEMKERIASLIGESSARRLHMGTFHSIFSHILRREAEKIGYKSNFTIYDETDSQSLVKAIVRDLQLDEKTYKPASVHSIISMAKNKRVTPRNLADMLFGENSIRTMPKLPTVYEQYQQRIKQANSMDFDDLLLNTFVLFRDHPDVCQSYANYYQYILVDEYQDTNRVQQSIIDQLTKYHQHICVVGDDAQSIYAFRGADIDNILNFQDAYPDAQIFKLERNYRSTQNIVKAANSLIKRNQSQLQKDIYSENDPGEKVKIRMLMSDREEAAVVCKEIMRIRHADHCPYSSFAILYRTNMQSRPFEEELRKQSLPYKIYGGLSFYQRKEIKNIVAYFRLVINPNDEEALKRIINYPTRGLGNSTLSKIMEAAKLQQVTPWQVIAEQYKYLTSVGRITRAKLMNFYQMIERFRQCAQERDAYEAGTIIINESGVRQDLYSSNDPEDISRQDNMQSFIAALKEFVELRLESEETPDLSLAAFLQEIALLTDKESETEETDDADRISLMTVHAAKGLEFDTVFVAGMEEEMFPSKRSIDNLRSLEEERRLFYVAITRARKQCLLSSVRNRWHYGQCNVQVPSRFLNELDHHFVKVVETESPFGDDDEENPQGVWRPGGWRHKTNSRRTNYSSESHFIPKQMEPDTDILHSHYDDEESPEEPQQPSVPPREATTPRSIHGRPLIKLSHTTSPSSAASAAKSTGNKPKLQEGNIIEHQRFGIGEVKKVEGTGENAKATVDFKNVGQKQLILKFAVYKVIG